MHTAALLIAGGTCNCNHVCHAGDHAWEQLRFCIASYLRERRPDASTFLTPPTC